MEYSTRRRRRAISDLSVEGRLGKVAVDAAVLTAAAKGKVPALDSDTNALGAWTRTLEAAGDVVRENGAGSCAAPSTQLVHTSTVGTSICTPFDIGSFAQRASASGGPRCFGPSTRRLAQADEVRVASSLDRRDAPRPAAPGARGRGGPRGAHLSLAVK